MKKQLRKKLKSTPKKAMTVLISRNKRAIGEKTTAIFSKVTEAEKAAIKNKEVETMMNRFNKGVPAARKYLKASRKEKGLLMNLSKTEKLFSTKLRAHLGRNKAAYIISAAGIGLLVADELADRRKRKNQTFNDFTNQESQ